MPQSDGKAFGLKNRRDHLRKVIAELGLLFGYEQTDFDVTDEQLEALAWSMLAVADRGRDYRNGNTDPTGCIDEGAVLVGRLLARCREALRWKRDGKERA